MVPRLCRTLGGKGSRPVVGAWGFMDHLYVFASVELVTSRLYTETVESRTGLLHRRGESKMQRLQWAFATHLRRLTGRYPADKCRRVIITIDNTFWHAGELVDEALADHPNLELKRIERFWKLLRGGITTMIAKYYPPPARQKVLTGT